MARGAGFEYAPVDADPHTLTSYAEARHKWMHGMVLKGKHRLHLYSPRGYLTRMIGHGRLHGHEVQHKNHDPWQVLLLSPSEEVMVEYCHVTGTGGKNRNYNFVSKMLFRFEELKPDEQFVSVQEIQERMKALELQRLTKISDEGVKGHIAVLERRIATLEGIVTGLADRAHDTSEADERIAQAVIILTSKKLVTTKHDPLKCKNGDHDNCLRAQLESVESWVDSLGEPTKKAPEAESKVAKPAKPTKASSKSVREPKTTFTGSKTLERPDYPNKFYDRIQHKLKKDGIPHKHLMPSTDITGNRKLADEIGLGWTKIRNVVLWLHQEGKITKAKEPDARKVAGRGRHPSIWRWKR